MAKQFLLCLIFLNAQLVSDTPSVVCPETVGLGTVKAAFEANGDGESGT